MGVYGMIIRFHLSFYNFNASGIKASFKKEFPCSGFVKDFFSKKDIRYQFLYAFIFYRAMIAY
jgi:hypothetical protein